MLVYLFKIVLLIHLSMADKEPLSPVMPPSIDNYEIKANLRISRSLIDNFINYDNDNSKLIQKIQPSEKTECYCGKKYPNSISDELNPTNEAEIERFVLYLYVKKENNERESYIYIPNAEKQKLMPDFSRCQGDILVKNLNLNEDENIADYTTELSEGAGPESNNINDNDERKNSNRTKEFSNNLLNIIKAKLLLQPKKTSLLFYPNKQHIDNGLLDFDLLDPKPKQADYLNVSRQINKRNLLQSIHSLLNKRYNSLEHGRSGRIRPKLPWLKVNQNSYIYEEKDQNELPSIESKLPDYTNDNNFAVDGESKYLRQNYNKPQGFQFVNLNEPVLKENSRIPAIDVYNSRLYTEHLNQLDSIDPITDGHSPSKPWSMSKLKHTKPSSNQYRVQKLLKPVKSSSYKKLGLYSMESKSAFGQHKEETNRLRPKVTDNLEQEIPSFFANINQGPLQLLKPESWSHQTQELKFKPAHHQNDQLFKPIQPSFVKNSWLKAPKLTSMERKYDTNINLLKPKVNKNLEPQFEGYHKYNDEEPLSLVSFNDEHNSVNYKPWYLSQEEEFKDSSNNKGLYIPNIYEALYIENPNDWSAQKPTDLLKIEPLLKPIAGHKHITKQNHKANRERWNLQVLSKFKKNIKKRPDKYIHEGRTESPVYVPWYMNILNKVNLKTRSIPKNTRPHRRLKSNSAGLELGTNSTSSGLPPKRDDSNSTLGLDDAAPKFRIIGGKAATGSGDPLKTKGRRSVSFKPIKNMK